MELILVIGREHDSTLNLGAVPSYCILPLFHPPAQPGQVTFNTINSESVNPHSPIHAHPYSGHISGNGHAFPCKNPAQMQRAFHMYVVKKSVTPCSPCSSIFLVDKCVRNISTDVMTLTMSTRSGSMYYSDHRPLANTPMTQRVSSKHNNRYGAVLSALYAFWSSREVATRQGASSGTRQDAYSIVLFDHTTEVFSDYCNRRVLTVTGRFSWKTITQAHQVSWWKR